jgi:adenosine deaminase
MSPSDALTREQIAAWPKAELHCHLDGSLRLQTMLDLAREGGLADVLPSDSVEGLHEILLQVDDSPTLEAYLAWFRYTIPLMQTAPALERIAYELAQDMAQDGVRYLEVRYAPILATDGALTMADANQAVLRGLEQARSDWGILSRVIVCGLRDRKQEASVAQARVAVEQRPVGVVGFDLAGGEASGTPAQHAEAFELARRGLLGITCHAGESVGPHSIRSALFDAGAHRIGHGVTLREDPDLMRYVVDHQIPLEMCPTSNVQTHVVDSFADHPIAEYVRAGVAVTVSTDNTLFSRTSTTEELWRAHTRCGLTADETRRVALAAFEHAFLPLDQKRALLADARAALSPPTR